MWFDHPFNLRFYAFITLSNNLDIIIYESAVYLQFRTIYYQPKAGPSQKDPSYWGFLSKEEIRIKKRPSFEKANKKIRKNRSSKPSKSSCRDIQSR